MINSNLVVTKHVQKIAENLLELKQFLYIAKPKLYYLIIKKHHRKWVTGTFNSINKYIFNVKYVKMNDDHIAALTSFKPGDNFLISVHNRCSLQGDNIGYCR